MDQTKAKMKNWVDSTTYSQGQTTRVQNSWLYQNGIMRIKVINKHLDYPGQWVIYCPFLSGGSFPLGIPFNSTPEQAQEKAISLVRDRLEKMLSLLPEQTI